MNSFILFLENDRAAFFNKILSSHPGELINWLVHADWLEERNDEMGKLIRDIINSPDKSQFIEIDQLWKKLNKENVTKNTKNTQSIDNSVLYNNSEYHNLGNSVKKKDGSQTENLNWNKVPESVVKGLMLLKIEQLLLYAISIKFKNPNLEEKQKFNKALELQINYVLHDLHEICLPNGIFDYNEIEENICNRHDEFEDSVERLKFLIDKDPKIKFNPEILEDLYYQIEDNYNFLTICTSISKKTIKTYREYIEKLYRNNQFN